MLSDPILEICHRSELPTPTYLIDLGRLDKNLQVLANVQARTGAKVILALKGFAAFATFSHIARVLCGTTASSVNEAKLGLEEFGGEVHVYCVAYRDDEFRWLSTVARHITLNSLSQWERLRSIARESASTASYGLRINPEYSEVKTELYNPCRPGTRFGVLAEHLRGADLNGIEGLHFHTMCEQNSDTLARTLEQVEAKFGDLLHPMRWVNFGGGHHITRPDYDVDLLCECVTRIAEKYQVQVYLEPGEAVALNTGFLVASVLDRFTSSGHEIAILDTSATAHMPDVLEMPYRPEILGGARPGEKPHTVTLGGLTCLAGDVIGDYSFDAPLKVGDRLVFTDMAHYTMVKNTTFNGVDLPSIALYDPASDAIHVVRRFGYEDYRGRLS
ncbi:MAG: carboxynorspermidine decarboxylase [Planctomycetales bacterium]|nr:carboxynorspermidine decarboxylase [Planctomycetales bacterium]